MNFERTKCVAKNFVCLTLMCICGIIVTCSVVLIIKYFMSEFAVLIFLLIILIIIIIWYSFDMCR